MKHEDVILKFETLSDSQMTEINGGVVLTTIVVGGTTIAVTGKMAVGAIATAYGAVYAIGRGLGYFK